MNQLQIKVRDYKYIPNKPVSPLDAGYELRVHVTKEQATRCHSYLQALRAGVLYNDVFTYAQLVSLGSSRHYLDGKPLFNEDDTRETILGGLQELLLRDLILLPPDSSVLLDTGVAVALPSYPLNKDRIEMGLPPLVHCLDIRPRSGLSSKHRITITNSPGLVDQPYRGWLKVQLDNQESSKTHFFSDGASIAQMTITTVEDYGADLLPYVVDELDETDRGTRGHGSSGLLVER